MIHTDAQLFTFGQQPEFPLVMAANRDEFFKRPTAAMDWWRSDQAGGDILAGRDLQSGGTWLAVNHQGTVTAVTNVREGSEATGSRTRGELPLLGQALPREDLDKQLSAQRDQYAGFNLVRVDINGGWYFSNRDAHPGRTIHRGIYGLSNHLLQTPWPKLLRLRKAVSHILDGAQISHTEQLHNTLINQLQDTTRRRTTSCRTPAWVWTPSVFCPRRLSSASTMEPEPQPSSRLTGPAVFKSPNRGSAPMVKNPSAGLFSGSGRPEALI